jgi:hypothetical protein
MPLCTVRGRIRAEFVGRRNLAKASGAFLDTYPAIVTRISKSSERAFSGRVRAAVQIVKRISQALDVERFFRYEREQVPLHLSLQISRVFDTLDGNRSSLVSGIRGNPTTAAIVFGVPIVECLWPERRAEHA